MYTATSAAVLLLASSAMAQSSTVVSIWGFGGDAADTIVASVATASPAATVFVLGCPEGSNHCAFPEDVTVTQGPSTLNYAITVAGDDILQPSGGPTPSSITYSLDCKRSASAQAVCGYTQLSLGESEVRTTTLSGTVMNSVPVTVTAGVEKLGSGSASATASATTTTTTADSTLTTSCSATSTASITTTITTAAGTGNASGATGYGNSTLSVTSRTATASVVAETGNAAANNKFGLGASLVGAAGMLMAAVAL